MYVRIYVCMYSMYVFLYIMYICTVCMAVCMKVYSYSTVCMWLYMYFFLYTVCMIECMCVCMCVYVPPWQILELWLCSSCLCLNTETWHTEEDLKCDTSLPPQLKAGILLRGWGDNIPGCTSPSDPASGHGSPISVPDHAEPLSFYVAP